MKLNEVQCLKAVPCKLQKYEQKKIPYSNAAFISSTKKLNLHIIQRQAAKDSFRKGIDWPAQSKTELSSDAIDQELDTLQL